MLKWMASKSKSTATISFWAKLQRSRSLLDPATEKKRRGQLQRGTPLLRTRDVGRLAGDPLHFVDAKNDAMTSARRAGSGSEQC